MKKSLILLTLVVFVFAGCAASNPSLNNTKVKEGMTSKQVEKAINWKYCKESM